MAPLPIAAPVLTVLVPATGASALALAAVTRLPLVMVPEVAVELASPLAPWPTAVADAVPALAPLPPVALAVAETPNIPVRVSEAVGLPPAPPAVPLPPAPP